MIISKLSGGLGNQMFQYAIGRHLAMKNNSALRLDTSGFRYYKLRNYDLSCFNIQENIATLEDLSHVLLPSDTPVHKVGRYLKAKIANHRPIQYIKEQKIDFYPEILTLGDNTYLDGYWQSEKYFSDITGVIRDEFTVKNKPDPINESYLEEIKNCESVSVHVRRGDYVFNPTANQVHGFLGLGYYQKAMKTVLEKIDSPRFFIFSDDPEWVEGNIGINVPTTCIKHNSIKSYEDMRLMSTCKHHIIANSSFSWWGAWLASNEDKIVIGPSRWFRNSNYNDLDRMPENWLRI